MSEHDADVLRPEWSRDRRPVDSAMNRGFRFAGLAGLALAALIIGLAILPHTFDVPADGPYRAMLAYLWFQKPHVAFCGTWLPGPMYLNGLFYRVVDDPLISTRIFNLLAGSLTMPLLYLWWEKVFESSTALIATVIALFLPLRIGLSVSSMTEAGFLFELVAGIWLFLIAADARHTRYGSLAASLVLLSLAALTRYEAWLLLPLFPALYFARTGRVRRSLVIAGILLAVPIVWMLGNQYCFSDALKGFHAATAEERYAEGVGLAGGIALLWSRLIQQLGVVIPFGLVLGVFSAMPMTREQWLRLRSQPTQLFYLALVQLVWMTLIIFATARGPSSFQTRYMLLALVLALPFAVSPFRRVIQQRPSSAILVVCIFLTTLAAAGRSISITWLPDIWLVARQRGDVVDDMAAVANWLQTNDHGQAAILTTPIKVRDGWAANYLPLFVPDQAQGFRTVSYWIADEDIRAFVRDRQPTLLITGAAEIDREEMARLERVLNLNLDDAKIVFTSRSGTPVRIYRIVDG